MQLLVAVESDLPLLFVDVWVTGVSNRNYQLLAGIPQHGFSEYRTDRQQILLSRASIPTQHPKLRRFFAFPALLPLQLAFAGLLQLCLLRFVLLEP